MVSCYLRTHTIRPVWVTISLLSDTTWTQIWTCIQHVLTYYHTNPFWCCQPFRSAPRVRSTRFPQLIIVVVGNYLTVTGQSTCREGGWVTSGVRFGRTRLWSEAHWSLQWAREKGRESASNAYIALMNTHLMLTEKDEHFLLKKKKVNDNCIHSRVINLFAGY